MTSTQPALLNENLIRISESLSALAATGRNCDLALQDAASMIWRLVGTGVFTIVLTDPAYREIRQVACAGCNEEFEQYLRGRHIGLGQPGTDLPLDQDLVRAGLPIEKYDLQHNGQGVARPEVARKYDLQSLLAYPLLSETRVIGYLNFFSPANEPFPAALRTYLNICAHHVSILIERLESLTGRHRLQQLNELMQAMAEAQDVPSLLSLILRSGADLVQAPRGTISQLNLNSGELIIDDHFGPEMHIASLNGQGLTNEALKRREPVLAADVTSPQWRDLYYEFWPDTRSELAVPILLNQAAVWVGKNIERASKPIGVLNLESPQPGAFTEEDARLLWSLASYGAVLIEGLKMDAKQARVAEMQRDILDQSDWDGTLVAILHAIKDTLEYDYVNISLVQSNGNIRTEHVVGVPPGMEEEFKRMADHPLKADGPPDIQADIVENLQIEVPAPDDPRFDRRIFEKFGHAQLIRVFLPMVTPAGDRVIGTVETGYRRSEHRTHIFEQDVQILKNFVSYASVALARRQNLVLARMDHELEAPVVGIRNNASFLKQWHHKLDAARIEIKCEDILTDCQTLLSNIEQFEYILGKPQVPHRRERILIYRDIIIKTIRQLKPLARDQGFDVQKFSYHDSDIHKIAPIFVDKAMLNDVFFNLFKNSIKYADNDPSTFTIRVEAEVERDAWLIKVKDWGIGVREEYSEDIFKEGFRTPEAESQNVSGSGLGLTLARRNMRLIGGDLRLTNLSNPTEFTVILPKSLANTPKEEP